MPNPIIRFSGSTLADNAHLLALYKKQIAIPYDDFLEDWILESKIFSIEVGEEKCGFFGLNGNLLTIFFLDDLHFDQGNRVFQEIKRLHAPKEAFIPTTDLSALAIVLEAYHEINIQALHFLDTLRIVRPAEYGKEYFRLAVRKDLEEIKDIAGDFLEDYEEKIVTQELYVLEKEDELLGIGVLVRNRLMDNCIGTGMLTKESHRGKGVGRSIILHLKDVAYGIGLTPVPGCWYYNTNSRKTLESAGYVTKSKLLRIAI